MNSLIQAVTLNVRGTRYGGCVEETAGPTVGELSEGSLLKRILPRLRTSPATLLGPGDDAAVVAVPDGRVVVSVDTQVQDQDFRLVWPNGSRSTGYDVGWKAAAQNLADIAAMGAEATSMVVSVTLPPATPVTWLEELADGLSDAIQALGAHGCSVVGGDLGRGRELSVTVAILGSLSGRRPVLRSGARPADVVALAGTAGRAAAGLALLESGHPAETLPEGMRALLDVQRRPRPPLAAGPAAAKASAHALIDLSDGLVRDAGRVAAASGVSIDLDPGALDRLAEPLQEAARLLGEDARAWVLGGGEDHGLLGVFGPDIPLPAGFTAIGSVTAGPPQVTVGHLSSETVGWDHFAD